MQVDLAKRAKKLHVFAGNDQNIERKFKLLGSVNEKRLANSPHRNMARRRKYLQKYRFVFKSGVEENTFDYLKRRQQDGSFKATYESEKLHYTLEGDYTPDFVIEFPDKYKRYIETKGYFDPPSRRKMIAVKKANPDKDIRILFVKDNPLRKGAKTTYSTWAEKNGFPWAVGPVPESWLSRE